MVGVVLVTYNRLDKLITALDKFEKQTLAPEYVLVVDNASTDGTKEYLAEWEKKEAGFIHRVISSETNTGGSGGFYIGLDAARKMNAEWIWLSDDDAFPEEDALEQAEMFIREQGERAESISAFCGAVINNGEYDLEHRRTVTVEGFRVVEQKCSDVDYKKQYFPLDMLSYVGMIIHKPHLEKVGLTQKDFFIWFDDTEHSIRLGKVGNMYCVPAIRIHHDMAPQSTELSWKVYYGRRNRLLTLKWHFPTRCYLYELCRTIKCAFADMIHKGQRRVRGKLLLCAVKDAFFERQGIHPIYRPGWKT